MIHRGISGVCAKPSLDRYAIQRSFLQFTEEKRAAVKAWETTLGHMFLGCYNCISAHCCYILPFTLPFEGLVIAARLLWEGHPISRSLLHRIVDYSVIQTDLLLEHKLQHASSYSEVQCAVTKISEAWFELRERCLFLTQDNRCSIYEVRPLACATYFVQNGIMVCTNKKSAIVGVPDTNEVNVRVTELADASFKALINNPEHSNTVFMPVPFYTAVASGIKYLLDVEKGSENPSFGAIEVNL